jgi:hypothetical protein
VVGGLPKGIDREGVAGGHWRTVDGLRGGSSTGSHRGGVNKARGQLEEPIDGRHLQHMKKTVASLLRAVSSWHNGFRTRHNLRAMMAHEEGGNGGLTERRPQ